MTAINSAPRRVGLALLLALSWPTLSMAQDVPPKPVGKSGETSSRSAAATDPRGLPADITTRHTLALPGRTLAFSATAGSIRIYDDKRDPQADIAVTSYQLDGPDPIARPVTFVFNGGPGASSAWLQLGAAGPWRVAMGGDALSPSATPELLPNAETWLDFTDLVFIDPVMTGYSRFVASGDEARKRFLSVDGDVNVLALTIRRWLEKNDRLKSPKYVMGESYGGIRGPKVVRNLQMQQGVGVKGLLMVSPLFSFRDYFGDGVLHYAASLPTMAAVAREAKGPVTRADMADAERYARGDFLVDFVRGPADAEATARLADKVAALTGIDPLLSRRLAGRIDNGDFRREFARSTGKVTGRYDASVTSFDPDPTSDSSPAGDPSSDPLIAPLTSAAVDLYRHTLNWQPDGSYELLNGAVNGAWDFGRGRAQTESLTQLRQILAVDPKLKLLVAHGLFDLATPYFGSRLQLDQLPPFGTADRIKFIVYPGGHMFYSRDAARRALRSDVQALFNSDAPD